MIQPEPEDLPKDNPKLEIAVLRYYSDICQNIQSDSNVIHNERRKSCLASINKPWLVVYGLIFSGKVVIDEDIGTKCERSDGDEC
ncbi:hypothetical protein Tco_1115129 [Tanacetum coccineum]